MSPPRAVTVAADCRRLDDADNLPAPEVLAAEIVGSAEEAAPVVD
ncbi:hypothetical protein [Streptomyces luteogriseus]|nr:hypothetical protein [uncultured Streptomyces sp.]